jgi:hypothetical protein
MSEGFKITSESGYLSVDVKRFSELRKECANRCRCGYCRLGKESAYAVARRAYRWLTRPQLSKGAAILHSAFSIVHRIQLYVSSHLSVQIRPVVASKMMSPRTIVDTMFFMCSCLGRASYYAHQSQNETNDIF